MVSLNMVINPSNNLFFSYILNSIKKLNFKCHDNCGEDNIKYDFIQGFSCVFLIFVI